LFGRPLPGVKSDTSYKIACNYLKKKTSKKYETTDILHEHPIFYLWTIHFLKTLFLRKPT